MHRFEEKIDRPNLPETLRKSQNLLEGTFSFKGEANDLKKKVIEKIEVLKQYKHDQTDVTLNQSPSPSDHSPRISLSEEQFEKPGLNDSTKGTIETIESRSNNGLKGGAPKGYNLIM